MVLVLMLRYTLTKLRNVGLSAILPLDHHVYLHKLTGVVILVYAWVHTLMHLINFGETAFRRVFENSIIATMQCSNRRERAARPRKVRSAQQ